MARCMVDSPPATSRGAPSADPDPLQDAGLSARPTRPGPKSRWLRNTQVSLELDRGICIWLLPGVPGSRAGLSPRLQPLTTLVITGLTDPSNNQSDHLREVLQRAGENPTWGP